jgi:hypothetical protein
LAPVADRGNTEIFEIIRGKVAQYFRVHAVLAERVPVLFKP